MKLSKALAVVAMATALLGVPLVSNQKAEAAKPQMTNMSRLVNCEDMDVQPCFTFDEGKWRIVYSYSPYKAKTVSFCGEAPCLSKKANKDGTRNYYWRFFL